MKREAVRAREGFRSCRGVPFYGARNFAESRASGSSPSQGTLISADPKLQPRRRAADSLYTRALLKCKCAARNFGPQAGGIPMAPCLPQFRTRTREKGMQSPCARLENFDSLGGGSKADRPVAQQRCDLACLDPSEFSRRSDTLTR
jgi:hypothetical protein